MRRPRLRCLRVGNGIERMRPATDGVLVVKLITLRAQARDLITDEMAKLRLRRKKCHLQVDYGRPSQAMFWPKGPVMDGVQNMEHWVSLHLYAVMKP